MSIFDKEEVSVIPVVAAIQEVVVPVVVAEPEAPVADNTTDYWATAWSNRGV